MIGNVVYIIVCHYFRENNHRQIETVHATWDGAFKRLQRIKEINKDAAIGQLQRRIKEVYGEDVKFRWNVMTYKYTLV